MKLGTEEQEAIGKLIGIGLVVGIIVGVPAAIIAGLIIIVRLVSCG